MDKNNGSERLCKWFVLIFVIFSVVECRRSGGGSRPSSSHYSRPSSSHYSRPSPSYYSHPSPSPSPSHYVSHSPSYPSPSSNNHYSRPSNKPPDYGFNVGTHRPSNPSPSPPKNSNYGHPGDLSYPHYQPAKPPSKPDYGFNPGTHTVKPSAPIGPPVNSRPLGFEKPTSGQSQGSQPPSAGWNVPGSHIQGGSQPPQSGWKVGQPATQHQEGLQPPRAGWNVGTPGHSNQGTSGIQQKHYTPVANPPPGIPAPVHAPPYVPHQSVHTAPVHNPAGYGAAPPAGYANYPQQNPYGYSHNGGYNYPSHYPSAGGNTNIHINNINTHNYHGGYGGHPGSYYGAGYSYPTYSYSSHDVGSGTLGFFLGYSLAKITTPTYQYHSFSNQYTPRYDHYEVHHYYHNRDSIPKESTIEPNAIVGCIGNSGIICPTGTTSLCTNNGAILCVASATSTVPCTDQKQANCIRTVVPCGNGSGDCPQGQNQTLTIPCISNAKVMGNITYVNNTIIVQNTTIINNTLIVNNSTTVNGTTATNGTQLLSNSSIALVGSTTVNGTTATNGTQLANVTIATNGTQLTNDTQLSSDSLSTLSSSTTEVPTTIYPGVASEAPRVKREAAAIPVNDFCVTILALPAERKATPQEQLLKSGGTFFSKFLLRAFGAS